MTTKPVSLPDAAGLVRRVRRAFKHGVGDVRSNDTMCGLLAIAEQWVDEQGRIKLADLIDLSKCPARTGGELPPCAHPTPGGPAHSTDGAPSLPSRLSR